MKSYTDDMLFREKMTNLNNLGCEATWWDAGGSVTKAEEGNGRTEGIWAGRGHAPDRTSVGKIGG